MYDSDLQLIDEGPEGFHGNGRRVALKQVDVPNQDILFVVAPRMGKEDGSGPVSPESSVEPVLQPPVAAVAIYDAWPDFPLEQLAVLGIGEQFRRKAGSTRPRASRLNRARREFGETRGPGCRGDQVHAFSGAGGAVTEEVLGSRRSCMWLVSDGSGPWISLPKPRSGLSHAPSGGTTSGRPPKEQRPRAARSCG